MKHPFNAIAFTLLLAYAPAWAWGPQGHQTVATIATALIKGSHAEAEVKAILGDLTLADVAVWPDCAKAIDPAKGYTYQHPGQYAECKVFETPAAEAEMSDFVRRNDKNCLPKPGEETCHKQYHYSDIAIQHSAYSLGPVGTRTDDIVGAVAAASHVLRGEAAPSPFNIQSKREALLLVVHYVGDLHQPLHVGAVYLNKKGGRIDPDHGTFDPLTATRGGNQIQLKSANMHATWDAIPTGLTASRVDGPWLAQARALPAASGDVFGWPGQWASGTLVNAQAAFKGVKFGALQNKSWPAVLPAGYASTMSKIKKQQLTAGGAHLAALLQAIWP